jgi:HemY protein
MLRILFFLGVVFALGLGFAWLADRPGDLVVTFDGYQYQVTLMVAAVAIAAIVAAVMLTWWVVKVIWRSPYLVSRYFRVRRRDRGYQALSTGMIAAGAGDAGLARKKKKEAMKLISADQEPLIHLLDAQASLLEGDHEAARRKFEAMLADPETRLLGLRGLYLEAERLGDRTAARHYAASAAQAAPQLGWAAEASLEEKAEAHEWDAALRLVETQKSTAQIERDAAARRKAVILTAKALETIEADPVAAKAAALEAVKLAPSLVPASVAAAKASFRLGDVRKGAKVLEAAWKAEPHPEIGEAYVHARPGDSTHDRLDRAKKLQSLRRNHVESALVVARAALDAGEFALARAEAEAAVRLAPREAAFLLLADIEEAETGDQGKVRQWLGRALRAPRDPAWVADGHIAERWAPASPVTGRLDAFEWRAPEERLGQLVEAGEEPAPAAPAPVKLAPPPPSAPPPPAPARPEDVEDAVVEAAPPAPSETPAPPEDVALQPVVDAEPVDEDAEPAPIRLPDDPGVTPEDAEAGKPGKFRLF